MLLNRVPEGYLPEHYVKSEYTFPYLDVTKKATDDLPYVTVQAKAMYHRLLDAIHGLVFDVNAMGYSATKKLHPGEVYMAEFSGHIELPRHNAMLTVFLWEQDKMLNYFGDKIAALVMQYQDEVISSLLGLSPDLLCKQEQSMFKNYQNMRNKNTTARLAVNSITSSYVHNQSLSSMIEISSFQLHEMAVSQLVSYLKHHDFDLPAEKFEYSQFYTTVDVEGYEELIKKIEHHPNLQLID